MSLEIARIPQFAEEFSEPLRQKVHLISGRSLEVAVVLLAQEIVPQRRYVGKRLEKYPFNIGAQ